MDITVVSHSLSVTKTVDQASISAPTTLNYIITVTNTGDIGLTSIEVSDDLAGGASYSSGDIDSDDVLDLNEVWMNTASYAVTQEMIDAGDDIVNIATVTSNETEPANAQAITTVSGTASLRVEKTVNQTSISDPTTLTYTITVTNTGNIVLTNVLVADDLAGGASY